jgi:hypothetical protein
MMPNGDSAWIKIAPGMSLRDWFAGMALGHIPALLDVSDENASCENIAGHAYQIADAMLAARETKS